MTRVAPQNPTSGSSEWLVARGAGTLLGRMVRVVVLGLAVLGADFFAAATGAATAAGGSAGALGASAATGAP